MLEQIARLLGVAAGLVACLAVSSVRADASPGTADEAGAAAERLAAMLEDPALDASSYFDVWESARGVLDFAGR
jgi:hypothetical protein